MINYGELGNNLNHISYESKIHSGGHIISMMENYGI